MDTSDHHFCKCKFFHLHLVLIKLFYLTKIFKLAIVIDSPCIYSYKQSKSFRLNRNYYRSTSCTSATIECNYVFYSIRRTSKRSPANIGVRVAVCMCAQPSIISELTKKTQERRARVWRCLSMWLVPLNRAISVNCLAGAWRNKKKLMKERNDLTRYSHSVNSMFSQRKVPMISALHLTSARQLDSRH